jgi:hypothetical protein
MAVEATTFWTVRMSDSVISVIVISSLALDQEAHASPASSTASLTTAGGSALREGSIACEETQPSTAMPTQRGSWQARSSSHYEGAPGRDRPLAMPPSREAMDKRRLGINLLLISLEFVALAHTILAVIFNTGLGPISAIGGAIVLVVLALINV